ncbi:MAG: arylsulfatase [Chlamydiales bacterium]
MIERFAVPALTPLLLAASVSLTGCAPSAHEFTAVLLVTVDTLRPDYLSANGYPLPTTPYLDGLIGEGTYFENAVTPIPRTAPAMASLFTGAYPHTTGVRTQTSLLGPDLPTLAGTLKQAGWQTQAVYTNHMMDPMRGLIRGFDDYRMLAPRRRPSEGLFEPPEASRVSEVALVELNKLDPDRPAFLWVHFLDPHIPYSPPAELVEAFDPGYEGPHASFFKVWSPEEDDAERGRRIHRGSLPERVNEHIRRLHAASYRAFDDALAPVIERARELFGDGLLIVFASDHGESLGEHDIYWDHGDYVYNATTRVPLAFMLPASHPLHGGMRRSERASLVDVAPTVLDLVGLAPASNSQIEGRSLVPAMRGNDPGPHAVFSESGHCYYPELVGRRVRNDVEGRFRAVFRGRWKLIWTPFQEGELEWELYDVEADPHETKNLYDPEHPELAQLQAELQAWMRDAFLDELPNLEGEDLETMKSLGYVR